MNRSIELLDQFNDIFNKLSQAINQKEFAKAKKLALKQQRLILSFEGSDYMPSAQNIIQDWDLVLNKYRKLSKMLEADLKELNANTRDNLKRLKGYAK